MKIYVNILLLCVGGFIYSNGEHVEPFISPLTDFLHSFDKDLGSYLTDLCDCSFISICYCRIGIGHVNITGMVALEERSDYNEHEKLKLQILIEDYTIINETTPVNELEKKCSLLEEEDTYIVNKRYCINFKYTEDKKKVKVCPTLEIVKRNKKIFEEEILCVKIKKNGSSKGLSQWLPRHKTSKQECKKNQNLKSKQTTCETRNIGAEVWNGLQKGLKSLKSEENGQECYCSDDSCKCCRGTNSSKVCNEIVFETRRGIGSEGQEEHQMSMKLNINVEGHNVFTESISMHDLEPFCYPYENFNLCLQLQMLMNKTESNKSKFCGHFLARQRETEVLEEEKTLLKSEIFCMQLESVQLTKHILELLRFISQ